MGYNTWNDLECKPKEKELQKIVKKLKKLGFLALGYQYITIDDCWMSRERDESGRLQADPALFPAGMADMAKFVKSNGFKFGIYTDRAPTTCMGYPASMGNEDLDAATFAEWGVDLVKNDGCWDPDCGVYQPQYPESGRCPATGRKLAVEKYKRMRQALNSTGRSILHAVCGWQPWYAPVGRQLGETWRVAADVRDWEGVYETARVMEQLGRYHGPNGWNDPDMLIGSSSGSKLTLTPIQARAQFSLWVVMAAPLILGVSVLHISGYDIETYSNKEAIQVNQDPLGRPARVVVSNCPQYPKFNLSAGANGTPVFVVPQSVLYQEDVSCGSHSARSCSECPQGNGEGWCHGECRWVAATKKCVPQEIGEKKEKKAVEDNPEPWSIPVFKRYKYRECHQVWTKELVSGEVALAAVNFAMKPATLRLPLASLQLPWSTQVTSVRDLWYKGSLLNPTVVTDFLELRLRGDGGHALLRLREVPNGTFAAGGALGGSGAAGRAAPGVTGAGRRYDPSDPVELSPAEDRLRFIERRQRFRQRMAEVEAEEEALATVPDEPLGGWLVPLGASLFGFAALAAGMSRLRLCRGVWPAAVGGARTPSKNT